MKAKLSSLAVSLCVCLGLVLTLMIAACTEDTPNNPSGGTSSGIEQPMSSAPPLPGILEIQGFDIMVSGENIYLVGNVVATRAEPIVKLEITPSNWVSYNAELPSARFELVNVKVDFEKVPCKSDNYFTVKACLDAGCSKDKEYHETKYFEKPNYHCETSSSGGAELSSSSESSWVFGAREEAELPANTEVSIGGAKITLKTDDAELDAQPSIRVNNGTIRRVESICGDDDIQTGKSYSSTCIGSTNPSATSEDWQNQEYYLIYIYGGDKYLIRMESSDGTPSTVARWPKKCTYWKATFQE